MSSEKLEVKIDILELVDRIIGDINAGRISRDEGLLLLKTLRIIFLRFLDAAITQLEGKEQS